MKCQKCGYEWKNRTEKPKACPLCKQYTYEKLNDIFLLKRQLKFTNTMQEIKKKSNARIKAIHNIKMTECAKCGSKERLHRHHPDYNKPLEVIILCKKCHEEEHRQLRNKQ